MRIAIVSDIHGNLPALEAVIQDIDRRRIDRVVNLGDSLSGPLLPLETAKRLMSLDWVHLAGNHERQLLTLGPDRRGLSDAFAYAALTEAEFEWMAAQHPHRQLSDEIFLCHGTPASEFEYFLETVEPERVRAATPEEIEERLGEVRARVVACGHSHTPRAIRSADGTLIVNPGSVGLPAYDHDQPYPHVMETGSPDARYAMVERVGGAWVPSLISVPYDHAAMASLALSRNRADWASALMSGYMR